MSAAFPEPRPAPPPSRPGPLSILLRLVLGLFALALPLFAVWLLTSLFLAAGAPLALALPLGIGVPLALPIAWDFWAEARYRKKQNPPARILSRADRIRLRILATCLLVAGVAVLVFGRASGNALASHGHWFMFGSQSAFADDVRRGVVGIGKGVAGITGQAIDGAAAMTASASAPGPSAVTAGTAGEPTPTRPTPAPPIEAGATGEPGAAKTAGMLAAWPLPAEPHPAIKALADEDATDLDAVAEHIRAREDDPFQRVKAIHDFVVRWVAYDSASLRRDAVVPPQDDAATFARRNGTCDGYVQMMVGLGRRLGVPMTRIVGRSRAVGTALDGFYHAWVGVEIGGRQYLVDPTWDAGTLFGNEFRARYATSYLFTPPDIFAYDHLPSDPAWSLTDPPFDEAMFLERPALSAPFFAWGLTLEGVTRANSVVTNGRLDFRIRNPKGAWVLVVGLPKSGDGKPFHCVSPTQANPIEAGCVLDKGLWDLRISVNGEMSGSYPDVGFLRVDSR